MKICVLLLMSLIPLRAFFQTDSSLVLQMHFHPAQTQVWVDGQKSMSNQFVVLNKGEHKITLWCDGHNQYDTTIVVESAGVIKFIKRLEAKDEYKSYLKRKKQFDNRKLACKVFQGGLIAATVASSAIFYSKAKTSMENVNASIAAYNKETQLDKFEYHRNNYATEKAKFETNNRNMYIVAGVGVLISTSFWIWREKNYHDSKRPIYVDSSKIRLGGGIGMFENNNKLYPTINLSVKL